MTMRSDCRIDWVAPPFAGHLFPILGLAAGLRARGFERQRVLCTPGAEPAIRAAGLEAVPFLAARAGEVTAISNTDHPVRGNPLRLARQLRANLALMEDLAGELRGLWAARPPELVIAEFTVPIAGWIAREQGAAWWTTTPSPCAIETRTGTPSYMGGWRPPRGNLGRARDALGRAAVRGFKRGVGRVFSRELRALGVRGLYRADGSERVYSDERILALGMAEFELDRADWPACLEFIGPVLRGAPASASAPGAARPELEPGRRHAFISLGTHVDWAKPGAVRLFREAAARLPAWTLHFSHGHAHLGEERAPLCIAPGAPENWREYAYVPYDEALARFDVAIVHGGTGVSYACLANGVPLLVWPQDYDQFDHAARVVERGLGVLLPKGPERVARALVEVADDPALRANVQRFRERIAATDPVNTLHARLTERFVAAARPVSEERPRGADAAV